MLREVHDPVLLDFDLPLLLKVIALELALLGLLTSCLSLKIPNFVKVQYQGSSPSDRDRAKQTPLDPSQN